MMAKLVPISSIGPPTSTNVDPEARQLVISQLVVIAVPVGTLSGSGFVGATGAVVPAEI